MRGTIAICLLIYLATASGCSYYHCMYGKRTSELDCPTDIRKANYWCFGEDAIFQPPCGPSADFYGHEPTDWRSWPVSGAEWRDLKCAPAAAPPVYEEELYFPPTDQTGAATLRTGEMNAANLVSKPTVRRSRNQGAVAGSVKESRISEANASKANPYPTTNIAPAVNAPRTIEEDDRTPTSVRPPQGVATVQPKADSIDSEDTPSAQLTDIFGQNLNLSTGEGGVGTTGPPQGIHDPMVQPTLSPKPSSDTATRSSGNQQSESPNADNVDSADLLRTLIEKQQVQPGQ